MVNKIIVALLATAMLGGCGRESVHPISGTSDAYYVDGGGDLWYVHQDKAVKVVH